MLEFDGIDLDGLAHDADKIEFPPVVPGRIVHIDADFLAYQVSAEKADGSDEKSFEDMQHNAKIAVETLRSLSAAEHVHLHLTPSGSNKGKRFDIANLKEYQATRADKPKPRYLTIMRNWLAQEFPGTLHTLCEADDGMSSSQYAALAAGQGNLSIIASKDKDLRMVPGLRLDWDTGAITESSEFGKITLLEKTGTDGKVKKKLIGEGQSFFWAQLLMGDKADNISGLPAVSGKIMNMVKPIAPTLKSREILADPNATEHKKQLAQIALDSRKSSLCGDVLAYDLLANLPNNKSCFHAVKGLYRLYGEETGFTHWSTGSVVPWGMAFASEAQLLWMRKEPHNENCVLNWWRGIAA